MYTMYMLGAQEGQKRASDSLQLQTAVSHYMGAEPGFLIDPNRLAISPAPRTLLDLFILWMEAVGCGGRRERNRGLVCHSDFLYHGAQNSSVSGEVE